MSDDELTEDPCRAEDTASGPRTLAFVLMFVAMFGCGIFVMLTDSFYWILLASVVGYTACVMLYGFARNKSGVQSFLFTCPVVVSQYPRLLKRHAAFLAILIVFATIVVKNKPHPSDSRLTSRRSDPSPFFFVVAIPIAALALTEIMTNRGVLERAHNERFGELGPENERGKDGPLSLFGRD
jgi:hypothetical protein